jgi:septum formation protein
MRRLPAERKKDRCALVTADTVVAIDGDVLGKPGSEEDARRMLRRLSGKWHEVFTGLAVLPVGGKHATVIVEKTRVEFVRLSENDIEEYVQTGEPFDKAGAYAIQGQGGKFIPRIEGCYFNVMGLPLARLYAILREIQMP